MPSGAKGYIGENCATRGMIGIVGICAARGLMVIWGICAARGLMVIW